MSHDFETGMDVLLVFSNASDRVAMDHLHTVASFSNSCGPHTYYLEGALFLFLEKLIVPR